MAQSPFYHATPIDTYWYHDQTTPFKSRSQAPRRQRDRGIEMNVYTTSTPLPNLPAAPLNTTHNEPSLGDVSFGYVLEGLKVFDSPYRSLPAYDTQKVLWCIYEWSLWVLIPLAFATIIQYYANTITVLHILIHNTILVLMLCVEFRSIRFENATSIQFYKYMSFTYTSFVFIYHIVCLAKVHTHSELVFLGLFTIHFMFYLISLFRVFLISKIHRIMIFRKIRQLV